MRSVFYGKYRGIATNNTDPMMQGRIKAKVPAVLGDRETGWALPCSPYGGKNVGFCFIPPIDANVWIEFEGGNPDNPIWSGCFWGAGEAPSNAPEVKVIKTEFAAITVKDLPGVGEIIIESTTGLRFVMNINGIELSNGATKLKITPASVMINDIVL